MSTAPQSHGSDAGAGQAAFRARIKRIANARDPIPADPTVEARRTATAPTVSPVPTWSEILERPARLALAAGFGILGAFFARWLRAQAGTGALTGDLAGLLAALDLACAVTFALVPLWHRGRPAAGDAAAAAGGAAVVLATMHNLVHALPLAFYLCYSPDWTREVRAETRPATLLLGGVALPLAPDAVSR